MKAGAVWVDEIITNCHRVTCSIAAPQPGLLENGDARYTMVLGEVESGTKPMPSPAYYDDVIGLTRFRGPPSRLPATVLK